MGILRRVLCLLLFVKLGYSYSIRNLPDVSQMKNVCPQYSVFATNGEDSACFWCHPYCKDRDVADCRNLCAEYMEDYVDSETVVDGTKTEAPPGVVVTVPPMKYDRAKPATVEGGTPSYCLSSFELVSIVIIAVLVGALICGIVVFVLEKTGIGKLIARSIYSVSTIDPEASTSDPLLKNESGTSTTLDTTSPIEPPLSNDTNNINAHPTAPSLPSNQSEQEGDASTAKTDKHERPSGDSSGVTDDVQALDQEIGPLTLNSHLPGQETGGNRPLRNPAENEDDSNVQQRGILDPRTSMSGVPSSAAIPLQPLSQQ